MPSEFQPAELAVGSTAAKVVARVWSGEAGTVVSAAPGAGKTEMIVRVLTHLVVRAGLKVIAATPTREQAYGLAKRLHAAIPQGQFEVNVNGAEHALPAEVVHAGLNPLSKGSVTVRTIDGCRYARSNKPVCDLMVVDEGYQSTFAALSSAAAHATQLLVVGDSGQIGPVVSEDVSVFDQWQATPHHRAPDVLALREDFTTFHLNTTYRLGPASAAVVDLLYPFSVVSGRPLRRLTTDSGPMPEIDTICCGNVEDLNNIEMLQAVAERAVECASGVRYDGDVDAEFPMSDDDVAVVVSRNSQVSLLRGMLDERGHGNITVGTANKLQGGQWSAVVALDPLAGVMTVAERDWSTGLLCVMISRHTTHLTWVYANGYDKALDEATDDSERSKGLAVRKALLESDAHTD